MQIVDVNADPASAVFNAARALRAGECVVLPTDTVYGIGVDALDQQAITNLLSAKQRGDDMPPPVLISDVELLETLAGDLSEAALILAQKFWPGPLTLIVKAHPEIRTFQKTLAIRVPDQEFTRALLRVSGPLAVSSANVSGQPPATNISQASAQLGEQVALYLDAGDTKGDVPSTIVDVSGERPQVLRVGRISRKKLAKVVSLDA